MVSQVAMTRARLYVLIDAFEKDMRNILSSYVLDHLSEEDALGESFQRAGQRRASDPMGDESFITDFLDMQECYDILNRQRESLPAELGRELRSNTASLQSMIPIRNRVMHGRPLADGDPESALITCRSFVTRYWSEVSSIISQLEQEPTWQPILKDQNRNSDRILHNLPLPEYDETGLIGRHDLCEKVRGYLLRRREPIITLVGEGGIGKTALALDVAYRILDDVDSPYECILWVSLKTERLTSTGIVQIADAARDLTGAANRLGKAFDSSFAGGASELSEAIEGIPTLLVIDNLETVTGDEVAVLYDRLPDSVTFLFTSRIGIGQFERRIGVEPLAAKEGNRLFRSFAKARSVKRLEKLSQRTVSEVVLRLRSSPLAIRWYVMAVEAGQQPDLALKDQGALIDFCVRSVYDQMSNEAQHLLSMISALDRPVPFDELAIHVDVSVDKLRKSVQQLLNSSMVTLDGTGSESLSSDIVITESARYFLRAVSPPRSDLIEATLERDRQFRRSDERRRSDAKSRRLAPNVVRTRTPSEGPTAHLLREALSVSRKETFSRAVEFIDRARAINPDYWEVDRVEAFLLSAEGFTTQATRKYRDALRKTKEAEDKEGAAVVSYFFAGHLSRKANEIDQAVEYGRVAHSYFNSPETAEELGKSLLWSGNFEESQYYLEECLESATGKIRLIAMTSMVDSWKRWSEKLLTEQKRPVDAATKAYAGFALGTHEISAGTHDRRLTEQVLEAASMFVRCASSRGLSDNGVDSQLDKILKFVDTHRRMFFDCRGYSHFRRNLTALARVRVLPPHARLIEQYEGSEKIDYDSLGALVGVVTVWRGKYGFIEHQQFPENVFFPASSVGNLRERGESVDLVGRSVRFTAKSSDDGPRPRADWVEVDW